MHLRFLLFLSIISLSACTAPKGTLKYKAADAVSMEVFLHDAIAEGLKRDKITRELALEVAAKDPFFIGKCNVCINVRKAFNAHSGFSRENEMIGHVEDLKKVKSMGEAGKEEMMNVVKDYLDQHFQNTKLSKKQKEAIKKELMDESEKGLRLVTNYTFCPSCKGSQGACEAEQNDTQADNTEGQ